MLRWNSNVHRESSLTISVGAPAAAAAAAATPIGPRGPMPPAACHPVIQLTYDYGCKPIKQAEGGMASFVLAAADGAAEELKDPDAYPVLLLAE